MFAASFRLGKHRRTGLDDVEPTIRAAVLVVAATLGQPLPAHDPERFRCPPYRTRFLIQCRSINLDRGPAVAALNDDMARGQVVAVLRGDGVRCNHWKAPLRYTSFPPCRRL